MLGLYLNELAQLWIYMTSVTSGIVRLVFNHFKTQLNEAKLTYYIRQYTVFAKAVVFLILKIVFPIVTLKLYYYRTLKVEIIENKIYLNQDITIPNSSKGFHCISLNT